MTEPTMVGDAPARGGNRRLFALLAIGAGLLLMALVLPGILFGGDDDGADDDELSLPPPSPATTTTTLVGEPPPETFEVFSTKNPFTPLVDTGAPGSGGAPSGPSGPSGPGPGPTTPGGGGGGDGTGGTSDGGTGGTGGTTDTTAPSAPGGGGASGGTATEPRPMQRVALLEVFSDEAGTVTATVRVNDTVYEVVDDEEFAGSYRVVSLSLEDRCGQFLFGDDRFRMCEGEELLK